MKLFTKTQFERLLQNGAYPDKDHQPVVKLFTPDAWCTWLLVSVDPQDPNLAFGLCDLGLGFPELGYVSISELQSIRGKFGLPVERDLGFHPDKPISEYAEIADQKGWIWV